MSLKFVFLIFVWNIFILLIGNFLLDLRIVFYFYLCYGVNGELFINVL